MRWNRRWQLNSCVEVRMNEWMDGIGPRSKCEIFCTLFWNGVLHISDCEFFVVEHGAFWSGGAFPPINQETKTNLPTVPSYPMKSPCDNNIPNEYQCVKLLYICVMKSMIELWEVNAFHCESEPLPSHFPTLIVPFTKSMFAAIVYILYQLLWLIITQKAQNYHSHTDSRSWSYFTVYNKLFL